MAPTRPVPGFPPFGRLLAIIAGFVAVGVPLVALAWHNLNHLLSGDVRLAPLVTVLAAGAGLAELLYLLARVIEKWTDVHDTETPEGVPHG